jgi:hypothetical protein
MSDFLLLLTHSTEVLFEKKIIIPDNNTNFVLGFQLTKFALYYYHWRLINKVHARLASLDPLVPLTLPMCCRASGDDSLSLSLSLSSFSVPRKLFCCLSSCHVRRGTRFHFMRDFGRSGKLTLEGRDTEPCPNFFIIFFAFSQLPIQPSLAHEVE